MECLAALGGGDGDLCALLELVYNVLIIQVVLFHVEAALSKVGDQGLGTCELSIQLVALNLDLGTASVQFTVSFFIVPHPHEDGITGGKVSGERDLDRFPLVVLLLCLEAALDLVKEHDPVLSLVV